MKISQTRLSVILMSMLLVIMVIFVGRGESEGSTYDYEVAWYGDLSGPWAEIGSQILHVQQAVFDYWNERAGKKIGVKVNLVGYDTKVDPARVASIYSRLVSKDPTAIAILSAGNPNIVPIVKRLSNDKIPLINSVGGTPTVGIPGGWVFNPMGSYIDMYVTGIYSVAKKWDRPGKPRVAIMFTDFAPARDMAPVLEAWLNNFDDIEFVGTYWHERSPTDLTGMVRKLVEREKVNYVIQYQTTPSITAFKSACRELGHLNDIHTFLMPSVALKYCSKVVGGAKYMEGDFVVEAVNCMGESEGNKIFQGVHNKKKSYYDARVTWDEGFAMYTSSALVLTRAIERAVKTVGAGKLSGQVLYDTLDKAKFAESELYGMMGGIQFDHKDRLQGPTEGYVYTMKNGKVILFDKLKMIKVR